jgi:uncharacterized RDD family membrane protein YckC
VVRRPPPVAALELVSPEQVPLRFRSGDPGRRVGALVIDFLLLELAVLGLAFAYSLADPGPSGEAAAVIVLLGSFLARTFYFPWFELRWQGRTPGKRRMGLRVVARDGGPLTAEMVFARNLTRELEVFVPLSVLVAGAGLMGPEVPAWVSFALLAWALVLMLVPLANRQHLRVGDLVAGTVVVAEPRPELLPDLAGEARDSRADREYVFRREHLDVYGIEELSVLEQVLRRPPSPQHDELLARLAETIQGKVDWRPEPGAPYHPERFLRAFYAAQRQRLEQGLLVGRRRERKAG